MLRQAGFAATAKKDLWLGTWSKHMKAEAFRNIQPFQKVMVFFWQKALWIAKATILAVQPLSGILWSRPQGQHVQEHCAATKSFWKKGWSIGGGW
jgi:hypothetical protein